jgi:hypothetical protein
LGGGGVDPMATYKLLDFKNYVMKIISKSPSRRLGKIKTEKVEMYIVVRYYFFQHSKVLVQAIATADLG